MSGSLLFLSLIFLFSGMLFLRGVGRSQLLLLTSHLCVLIFSDSSSVSPKQVSHWLLLRQGCELLGSLSPEGDE